MAFIFIHLFTYGIGNIVDNQVIIHNFIPNLTTYSQPIDICPG